MYKVSHYLQKRMSGRAVFEVQTDTITEAIKIQGLLKDYDLFLIRNNARQNAQNTSIICEYQRLEEEWYELNEDECEVLLKENEGKQTTTAELLGKVAQKCYEITQEGNYKVSFEYIGANKTFYICILGKDNITYKYIVGDDCWAKENNLWIVLKKLENIDETYRKLVE